MVGEMLGDAVDDNVLAQINLVKIQNQQNDLIAIQRGFTSILKNIKEKMNTGMKKSQKMTAEIFEQIRNNLSRGKGALPYRLITAEKMVDSVIAAMGNIGGATQEMKDDLHKALMPFFSPSCEEKIKFTFRCGGDFYIPFVPFPSSQKKQIFCSFLNLSDRSAPLKSLLSCKATDILFTADGTKV